MKCCRMRYIFMLLIASVLLVSCGTTKLDRLSNKVYIQRNYKELKLLLPEAQVTILNDTIKVLFPNNLLFKTAESQTAAGLDPLMERFAICLNKYKKTSIIVAGHTDNVGTFEKNIELSTKRSEHVAGKLATFGVLKARLHAWGHGDQYPIVLNDTEKNRSLNRRVEFIIMIDVK